MNPPQTRIARYEAVSAALARLDDRHLADRLDRAPIVASGIGGPAVRIDIADTPVFAKRIALTDVDCRPENVGSTANLFGIPTFCQYGVGAIGGPGFGGWRELAANTMTTEWVRSGQCAGFPLMYHWRVLPGTTPTPEEHSDVDAVVRYWDGSDAVRARLEALAGSSAVLVLFLEYVPLTLRDWLAERLAAGAVESACAMLERFRRTVAFMNVNGLVHFDAHLANVLTDGRQVYVTDLGLATSERFELTGPEREFLRRHDTYDDCYVTTWLVNSLVMGLTGLVEWPGRFEYVRRCAENGVPADLPAPAAAVIRRYAPVAVLMNDFCWQVSGTSRTTPYPADELRRACAAALGW